MIGNGLKGRKGIVGGLVAGAVGMGLGAGLGGGRGGSSNFINSALSPLGMGVGDSSPYNNYNPYNNMGMQSYNNFGGGHYGMNSIQPRNNMMGYNSMQNNHNFPGEKYTMFCFCVYKQWNRRWIFRSTVQEVIVLLGR
jgi:hypothetical protein